MTRRLIAGVLCALVLAGCGSFSLGGASSAVHHYRPRTHSRLNHVAWCGFHAWRLYHDVKRHKLGWAAFQTWRTVHHCGRIV